MYALELAILTLLLLLGGGAFSYYQGASETATVAAPSPIAAAAATDHSIAVLPFVNMSPDKDQEYFADGISEELLRPTGAGAGIQGQATGRASIQEEQGPHRDVYPGIAAAGLRLNGDQAVVDGEIVALDGQGSPSFQALQHRSAHQIAFYAFDLLHLDGKDLTGVVVRARRAE